ncbi:MAG: hypothetical protein Ct9H300mP12_02090 [Acidimicrobiales bacterium]|nr:MAG: hypothetical protein Ct9H300mP12_02090 [Acidimicrobiales bacterium]
MKGTRGPTSSSWSALAEVRPGDAVLSEEGTAHACHPDRGTPDRTWIIDPVDGTREYSEPPRTDWAVHVALAVAGEPVAGPGGSPGLGCTLSTARPARSPTSPGSRTTPDGGESFAPTPEAWPCATPGVAN